MINELQHYKKSSVFSPSEIESIVQKRRGFEELIQTNKTLHTLLKYIEYEVQLERIFKKRTQRQAAPENHLRKRIDGLFARAAAFFPSEDQLLSAHLDYLLHVNDKERAYQLALDIPRKRPGSAELWRHCAKALRKLGEIEASRSLLQRGLRLADPRKIIAGFIQMEEEHPEDGSEQLIAILRKEIAG